MTNTKPSILLALSLLALQPLSGCKDGNTVTGPTSAHGVTPTPTPAAFALKNGDWNVGIRVISVAGPSFCVSTPGVGGLWSADYSVDRSGGSISFIPQDPSDWNSYIGTVQGASFSASNRPVPSTPDSCTHYLQSSSLSGSFSADGSQFTATEIWSYTLDSGQVKTVTLQWGGHHL